MATKTARSPWTKAQRAKLTALLRPDPSDPPDFFPTAEQAWSATGFDGDPPTKWTPAIEKSLVDRAWNGNLDAFLQFLVAARGLEAAIDTLRRVQDPEDEGLGYEWFRRYLYQADEATFARVHTQLTANWKNLTAYGQVGRAFALSRDPSLARGLVDALQDEPFALEPLMIAVEDAALARTLLEASTDTFSAFNGAFDLVESLGGEAAPLLQSVLDRFHGKAAYRKPIEQAWKLASELARQGGGASQSGGASAAKPIAAPKGPSLPEEAFYDFEEVAFAGSFANLDPDVITLRLRARRLRPGGNPGPRARVFFAGQGAKPELRQKAQARRIPILGQAELEQLIATPFFEFRKRFTTMVEEALSSSSYTVHSWWIGEPATGAEISSAEAALGAPLDPTLRAFYTQCNGLQLRADKTIGKGKSQALAPKRLPWGAVGSSYGGELGKGSGGVVAILSLDELVKTRGQGRKPADASPGEKVTLGRRAIPARTFLENMYLLDGWYDYYPGALFVDRERTSFHVLIGDDHGAVWDDPSPESFESYLESALSASFLERPHGKRRFRRASE